MSSSTIQFKKAKLGDRWLIFIHERFPIAEHAVSIFFLTLGNSAVACAMTGSVFHLYNFSIAYVVCLLFFFRLRCFDEIKDYATDKSVNPGRPLARGLLSIDDVKKMFVQVTLVEMVLVSLVGVNAFLVHLSAVAYSYLMYKEFFIGRYLSPHLTTYALTHTFVSVLVAFSIFTQMTGAAISTFQPGLVILGLACWSIFNLFEFARKTFSPEEERKNVPTYTTTFGIPGAVLLSLSQVAASVMAILYLFKQGAVIDQVGLYGYFVAASLPLMTGIGFIFFKSRRAAQIFRATCSAYLIVYYGLLSYHGFAKNIVIHIS